MPRNRGFIFPYKSAVPLVISILSIVCGGMVAIIAIIVFIWNKS